jgi:hypothetical protein
MCEMTGAREITVKITAIAATIHTRPFMRPMALLFVFILRPFFFHSAIESDVASVND